MTEISRWLDRACKGLCFVATGAVVAGAALAFSYPGTAGGFGSPLPPAPASDPGLQQALSDGINREVILKAERRLSVDCTPTQRANQIPSHMAMRDVKTDRVAVLEFDTAWHQAETAQAWTDEFCYPRH